MGLTQGVDAGRQKVSVAAQSQNMDRIDFQRFLVHLQFAPPGGGHRGVRRGDMGGTKDDKKWVSQRETDRERRST